MDPANPEVTKCTKQAQIYSPLFGAGAAIEQFALTRFKKNADKAAKGLQFILEKLPMASNFKGYC